MIVEILQDKDSSHNFLMVIKGIWLYPVKANMQRIAGDWGFIAELPGK